MMIVYIALINVNFMTIVFFLVEYVVIIGMDVHQLIVFHLHVIRIAKNTYFQILLINLIIPQSKKTKPAQRANGDFWIDMIKLSNRAISCARARINVQNLLLINYLEDVFCIEPTLVRMIQILRQMFINHMSLMIHGTVLYSMKWSLIMHRLV